MRDWEDLADLELRIMLMSHFNIVFTEYEHEQEKCHLFLIGSRMIRILRIMVDLEDYGPDRRDRFSKYETMNIVLYGI